jgi:hypothetical protein
VWLLRVALVALTSVMVVDSLIGLLRGYPAAVDIEIPLRAAERWLAGGRPYLPESFLVGPGYDAPYLYPPFALPFVALLTALPRAALVVAWIGLCAAAAAWAARRLAVPWGWLPLVLLWPPFFEGILGGNIQVLLFAAFVALLYSTPRERATGEARAAPFRPVDLDPGGIARPALVDGLLGIANGALKATQVQPWVYLLRRRPRAALLGLAVVSAIVVATLPLTGLAVYGDWFAQLNRANDPTWPLAGAELTRFLPRPFALVALGLSIAAIFLVPRRRAGVWVGLLMVVGSPSLRMFGLLFLLPGMLTVRREVALLAAFLIASYTLVGIWSAVTLVGGTMLLSGRWPALLEPDPRASG